MTRIIHFCLYAALGTLPLIYTHSGKYLEAAIHLALAAVVICSREQKNQRDPKTSGENIVLIVAEDPQMPETSRAIFIALKTNL